MGGGQRRFAVVADLLVELVVLFLRDVFFGPRPERCRLVDGFPFAGGDHLARLIVFALFPLFFGHHDGQRDMVGIFIDDALEFPGVQVLGGIVLQMQGHAGAALASLNLADVKLTSTVANPAHTLGRGQTGAAAFNSDFVGHDEARIKADAKLANQLGIVFLVARQVSNKVARAALSDGTEVVYGLLLRHTDAVVADGQGFGRLVKDHTHFQLGVVFVVCRFIERFETQFVAGVRRIGNQLAQENFRIGVERVSDQLEQLGDFGLKGKGLFLHGVRQKR